MAADSNHVEAHDVKQEKPSLLDHVTLELALSVIILLAMIIVACAYGLYWHSKDRKYDIARPGNQAENTALGVEDSESDTTSPVDAKAVERKIDYLKEELRALGGMNGFQPNSMSDESLHLTTGD